MIITQLSLGLLLSTTGVIHAATIRIDAGQNGLAYTPDSVTANVGDILEFHFHPLNHSVVMSDFDNPCQPAMSGGFFSGFMPVSSGEAADTFQITINSTDPIFFYCAQNVLSHCKSGMSGVVNPSSSQTLDAYKTAAKSVASAGHPNNAFGGTIVAASGSTSSAPSPSQSSSSGGGPYGGGSSGGGGNGAADVQIPVSLVVSLVLGIAAYFMG